MDDFDPTAYEDGDLEDVGGIVDPAASPEARALNKTAFIFAIDVGKINQLFKPDQENAFPISRVLLAVSTCMRSKVWLSEGSDMTSLIFYNTSRTKNPMQLPGICIVQELAPLTGKRVKELLLMHDPANLTMEKFSSSFPPGKASIADVFSCAQSAFDLHKGYERKMFIFTEDADPPGRDVHARLTARTRATDLQKTGTQLELFCLDEDADLGKFWLDILQVPIEQEEEYRKSMSSNVTELQRLVLSKTYKKRPLNCLDFWIPGEPAFRVCVQLYAHIVKASKPKKVPVVAESHVALRSETAFYDTSTGGIIDPATDVQFGIPFDKNLVKFEKLQVAEIKTGSQPAGEGQQLCSGSITLVGFAPRSTLKESHVMTHAYFLYPNDSKISGSSDFCAELIRRMELLGKVGLVRFTARSNSVPSFAALVSQREEISDGVQLYPPGFHLIPLPYANDVRKLVFPGTKNILTDHDTTHAKAIQACTDLVRSLRINDWSPELIDNPVLQRMHAVIEAHALGLEQPANITDQLQISPALKEKSAPYLSDLFTAVRECLPGMSVGHGAVHAGVKRKPVMAEEGGGLGSMTVAALKDWMKERGLPVGGSKAALVQRALDHIEAGGS